MWSPQRLVVVKEVGIRPGEGGGGECRTTTVCGECMTTTTIGECITTATIGECKTRTPREAAKTAVKEYESREIR